jgi:hypothetical protein
MHSSQRKKKYLHRSHSRYGESGGLMRECVPKVFMRDPPCWESSGKRKPQCKRFSQQPSSKMSDATATVPTPVYFELSWSILSSIGLINVLYGILVVGITNLSPISAVPIIVSAAGALANGLCYYSFYGDYSRIPTVVAGVFADVLWLVSTSSCGPRLQLTLLILLSRYRRPAYPSTVIRFSRESSFIVTRRSSCVAFGR